MPSLEFLEQLDSGMELSEAKVGARSAAVAASADGEVYTGSYFGSQTRLTTVEAEVVALIQATRDCDYDIRHITALYENAEGRHDLVSPVVVKSLIDFALRTDRTIEYKAVDAVGTVLFHSEDIAEELPFYKPVVARAAYLDERQRNKQAAWNRVMGVGGNAEELKFMAQRGANLAFTVKDAGQRYGAVAVSTESKAYLAGQYSGLNDRTIHAEMCAVIAAKMDGAQTVVELGVVSTRFKDTPADICGCCRQFLAEHANPDQLMVSRFASDDPAFVSQSLSELLPDRWGIDKI